MGFMNMNDKVERFAAKFRRAARAHDPDSGCCSSCVSTRQMLASTGRIRLASIDTALAICTTFLHAGIAAFLALATQSHSVQVRFATAIVCS